MDTLELRKKVLKSLAVVDEKFLKMVDALHDSYTQNQNLDFFEELPIEIQEILLLSRNQAETGKTKLHKDVMKSFRKKYNFAG